MSILDHLRKDHEDARTLLSKVIETDDPDERTRLFDKLAADLSAHNKAEEAVLYKRLETHEESRPTALEGEEEHAVADRVLESLKKSSAKGGRRWKARAVVLKELLEHHVEEEEDETFEKARAVFDPEELEAMGEAFTQKKQELMTSR